MRRVSRCRRQCVRRGISTTRSQRAASAGSWVMMTKVASLARCRSNNRLMIAAPVEASRLPVGLVGKDDLGPSGHGTGNRHALLFRRPTIAPDNGRYGGPGPTASSSAEARAKGIGLSVELQWHCDIFRARSLSATGGKLCRTMPMRPRSRHRQRILIERAMIDNPPRAHHRRSPVRARLKSPSARICPNPTRREWRHWCPR